jgi:hypothetical protein
MMRAAIVGALAACAGLGLIACGGNGVSQDELEHERADAAQNARQEAEIKALKREVQKQGASSSANGSASSSSSGAVPAEPPSSGRIPADAYYCGSAYGDGSASCPFVENVADDYYASGENSSFTSYSPTTELTYTVTCNGDNPTVCTAGRAAVIYIP